MSQSSFAGQATLANGSVGDPVLYVDYPDRNNALLFDAGENCSLPMRQLADLQAVFITHHHMDHFCGLDRILRANIGASKTLSLFGPQGTAQRILSRLRCYELPQSLASQTDLELWDWDGRTRWRLQVNCGRLNIDPPVEEQPHDGALLWENSSVAVEAAVVQHTVPCLAYALIEKPGYFVNAEALAGGPLKPGKWISQVRDQLLRSDPATSSDQTVRIQGLDFSIRKLADEYFVFNPGSRVGFVTDTVWNDQVERSLLRLVGGAQRLYCDSFYAAGEVESAARHCHLRSCDAAELAVRAKVGELVLMHFASRYQGRYPSLVAEAQAVFANTRAEWRHPEEALPG